MSIEFTVRKRKQHFLIENMTQKGKEAVLDFARKYVHWGVTREGGRFRKAPLKVFAASTYQRDEFRFLIPCWDEFLEFMKFKFSGDYCTVTEEAPPEGEDVEIRIEKSWKLREKQVAASEYILDASDNPQKLLALQTGFGKAQPLTSKYLTNKGFVRLSELRVGMQLARHDGCGYSTVDSIHPQGETEVFEFVFNDGRKVEADAEHYWRIYSTEDPEKWVLLTLNDLRAGKLKEYRDFPLYVPDPHLPELVFEMDPYQAGRKLNNPPRQYLNGSLEQRLEFVRGSLDANKAIFGEQGIEVDTSTEEHGLFLQEMIWSIGGWCYLSLQNGKPICLIRHPEPMSLFKKRKHTVSDAYLAAATTIRLRLAGFQSKGMMETACIKTRNEDELYITDNYVVTHNTFISIFSLARRGKRAVYIMRPMYMNKWKLDFEAIYENKLDDVLMIRGGDQLRRLFQAGIDGTLTASTIVISNKTYQSYLSDYEKYGDQMLDHGWNLKPDDFWETCGIGSLAIDEIHQDFHLNYKIALYSNVELAVSMSATFISDDAFVARMQQLFCPATKRFVGGEYNKYISSSSYAFQFANPEKIRTTEWGDTRYSHHVFERCVMADKRVKENYYRMINGILEVDYFRIKDPGETAIVFMSSIKMCTDFTNWLSKIRPGVKIKRYVEGDSYEDNFIDSDIVITTVGKSGAAVDKPLLRTNIRAINIRSTQSIHQIFGRTRVMKSGATPRFIYLYCSDIPKQVEYHENMVRILGDTALDYRARRHDEII